MPPLIDHLKIEWSINPKTGEQQYLYYYKGKQCSTDLIKGPLAKQYIGYSLIMKDLEDAEGWLRQAYELCPQKESSPAKPNQDRFHSGDIGDEKNHRIVKSLFFSSLIFYGKCFTQADGRGVKLEKSNLPIQYHERHDRVMNYRNTLAAHSGIGNWDTGKARLVLPPIRDKNIGLHLYPELHRLDFEDDRIDDHSFLDLIKHVQIHVQKKIPKIFDVILKKIVLEKPKDYWYRSTPKNPKKARRRKK